MIPACWAWRVRRIEVWQGPKVVVLEADDPRLCDGFHAYEPDCAHRWTDGEARLPPDAITGSVELVVLLGGATQYADTEGEAATLRTVA